MAIGRTNVGGNQLNFKVVGGTTEPADPKENTIWVKTNVPIHIVEMNNVNGLMSVGVNAGWVYINIESSAFGEKNTTIQVHDKKKFIYITPYGCQQNQDGTASGWKWMNAYIYKSGAWIQFSSEFAATVNVSYPAGSTLTCTDGTTTLTAGDTSGEWTFTIHNAGNWTVTATSGSNSASQTVSITTSGQSEQVELRYS